MNFVSNVLAFFFFLSNFGIYLRSSLIVANWIVILRLRWLHQDMYSVQHLCSASLINNINDYNYTKCGVVWMSGCYPITQSLWVCLFERNRPFKGVNLIAIWKRIHNQRSWVGDPKDKELRLKNLPFPHNILASMMYICLDT